MLMGLFLSFMISVLCLLHCYYKEWKGPGKQAEDFLNAS